MTAFLPVTDLFPAILPHAISCPDPYAVQCAVEAAEEFCRRARVWRERVDLDIDPSGTMMVPLPGGARLSEIERASWDGSPLIVTSTMYLDRQGVRWEDLDENPPSWVFQTELNTIRVAPATYGSLSVWVWARPAPDAIELPDWLVTDFRHVLKAGALARILATPKMPWTDPALASGHATLFEQACQGKSSYQVVGQQRAPIRATASFM